jgi:tight adherence protein B
VARPRFATLAASTVGLAVGYAAGGPVAAIVVAVYAGVGALGWRQHAVRARSERAFVALLDAVDAVTGDLRAGLAPFQGAPYPLAITGGAAQGTTYGASTYAGRRPFDQDVLAGQDRAVDAAIARLDAAYRISEALGAPLADLLDRVDADLRADRRLRSSVRAQTAGAQATSVLLAALPFVGLAMGAGIGAHPMRELLHTRLGAACALTAVALQCAGLGWTARLVRGATR